MEDDYTPLFSFSLLWIMKTLLNLLCGSMLSTKVFKFGFTMDIAFVMYKKGHRYFKDIWDLSPNDFLKRVGACLKFFLALDYMDFWS